MDKNMLAKLVTNGSIDAMTIPSTATRQERDRILRDFTKRAENRQSGEVVLIMVRP